MTRDVLRDGVKKNLRGIAPDGDFAAVPQASRLIRRTLETHDAAGALGNDRESVIAIIERRGGSIPVLLVSIAFGQRPDFVAAIVDPAATRLIWRKILALVNRIHEQVAMPVECDLHQP